VGRQELIYGDQRLIGTADWLNYGHTFDAAKLRFENPQFWVDAFISQPVIPDKHEFDESDNKDLFSGVYGSTRTLLPFQETQLYFLAHNVDERSTTEQNDKLYPLASPRDIYTVGVRLKSLPGALGHWDYEAEGDYQFGRYKASNTAASLDQEAFAAHVAGGYTWANALASPRLGLEYNFASGDSNPNDNKHGTFDNLFPSNHGLYGIMDFFAWQNLHDLRLSASIRPDKDLLLSLGLHEYWLADTHDYFYAANGTPRKTGGYGLSPSANSNVGSELDLTASFAITRYASVQGGYGHFFTGDYVKDSLAAKGGARDADFLYAQLYFNF
jgi:Alginate export